LVKNGIEVMMFGIFQNRGNNPINDFLYSARRLMGLLIIESSAFGNQKTKRTKLLNDALFQFRSFI
jgi:hypothetical protein